MKKGCMITIAVLIVLAIIGALLPDDNSSENNTKGEAKTDSDAVVVEDNDKGYSEDKESKKTKWVYRETKDEMTEKVSYFASLVSDNEEEFDFPYNGGSTLSINVRESPKYGTDVYFSISKGQFNGGIDGGKIQAKFDGGNIETYYYTTANDGSMDVIFLSGKKSQFISKLKEAKSIKVQTGFFQEGDRTFTFTTPTGLVWEH